MLLALHASLAWGIDSLFSRAMLLVHFGIFLIWQPVWRGERNLEARQAFLVVIVGLLLAGWNSWWLMAVWLAVLFALIGGNLLGSEQPRHGLRRCSPRCTCCRCCWCGWCRICLPSSRSMQRWSPWCVMCLPLLPLAMIAIPVPAGSRSSPLAVDLFYSLMLFPAGDRAGARQLRRQAGQPWRLSAGAGAKPDGDGARAGDVELVVEPAQRLHRASAICCRAT